MTSHQAHEHGSGGMEDLLHHRNTPLKRLWASLAITVVGMAIEIVGGLLTGSLALLSDAGHMFTHVFALGISAFAVRLASQPACHHRTFGLLRAEVLAAYTNAIFLFAVTAYIAYEGVVRLLNPVEIFTGEMLVVAAVGLVVNILSIILLHGHGKNISVRSAVAHMMADTLSSVAIIVGALVMARTGWRWIDPLLSIGIAGVILLWAWGLFRDSTRILMEVAPSHVNTDDVELFVSAEYPDIASLDRIRIWSITEDVVAFSSDVVLSDDKKSQRAAAAIVEELAAGLKARFHFTETTLELRLRE
ncbi:MAG: cation transporter [Lentisphaerae bacterium]|nr:cation transporter [Lentisphaerota bacterium]